MTLGQVALRLIGFLFIWFFVAPIGYAFACCSVAFSILEPYIPALGAAVDLMDKGAKIPADWSHFIEGTARQAPSLVPPLAEKAK